MCLYTAHSDDPDRLRVPLDVIPLPVLHIVRINLAVAVDPVHMVPPRGDTLADPLQRCFTTEYLRAVDWVVQLEEVVVAHGDFGSLGVVVERMPYGEAPPVYDQRCCVRSASALL